MEITFIDLYGESIMFSLIVLTFLYNIFLIARIKFGEILITKLTLLPYYLSACFCAVFMVHELFAELIIEKSISEGVDNLIAKTHIQYRLEKFIHCSLAILFMCFIGFRIFENQILHVFVDFQDEFRLEELEVAKVHYTERENRIEYFSKLLMFLFIIVYVAALILQEVFIEDSIGFNVHYVNLAYSLVDLFVLLFEIRLYFNFNS